MEHFMVSNDKRVTVILVLCATSDEKPAAGRGAKKGIAMQTLA